MSGDPYKRVFVGKNTYQCGCKWRRTKEYGDVLVECPLHSRASEASYKLYELKRKNSLVQHK